MNIDEIKRKTSLKKVSYFKSIDSTNSYLLEHGECGEICVSDSQSAGRGRRGNSWISPDTGNLYFSLCWCFDKAPKKNKYWSLLGLVVGIAIAEVLEELGVKGHGVKWPNDIFWQQRKMGGILLETQNLQGKVVIGIGLNLKMPKKEQSQINQAVVTLADALDSIHELPSKNELVISLVNKLNHHLKAFDNLNFEVFNALWNHWDILYGKTVSIKQQGIDVYGEVLGIDSLGRLIFKKDDGEILSLSSAEIKLGTVIL